MPMSSISLSNSTNLLPQEELQLMVADPVFPVGGASTLSDPLFFVKISEKPYEIEDILGS